MPCLFFPINFFDCHSKCPILKSQVSIAIFPLPYQFQWHSLQVLKFKVTGFNCHVPSSLSISITFTRNAQFWISRCVNCHVLSSLSIPMTFTRNPQFWSSRFQLPCTVWTSPRWCVYSSLMKKGCLAGYRQVVILEEDLDSWMISRNAMDRE